MIFAIVPDDVGEEPSERGRFAPSQFMIESIYGQFGASLPVRDEAFNEDGGIASRRVRPAMSEILPQPGGKNTAGPSSVGPSCVPPRSLVLVGLMGAGKTNIGRRLAARLQLPFVDADSEIEAAAGESIEDIFQRYGEAYFREGERRVIARLLDGTVKVLATGGGAFMDPQTRQRIREQSISIWLRADLDLLVARVGRRENRPLLKDGDPRATLAALIERRYPTYAEADIVVDSIDGPPEATLGRVIAELKRYLASQPAALDGGSTP
jgi:shikimate kinase